MNKKIFLYILYIFDSFHIKSKHLTVSLILINFTIYTDQFPNLVFHDTKKTLIKITEIISNKQKGAYLRFGDGDINLAIGENDLLQHSNYQLMIEMQEAFALNGPTILKSLPLCCKEYGGYETGMFPGNHECPVEWCINLVNKAKTLWGEPIKNVYSPIALHFSATQYPDLCMQFLKNLKKSNCVLLVGNENIPEPIRELLFGCNCTFIPSPAEQSYSAIDRLEKECLEILKSTGDYKIIIIAMGCSGRILQKRLWGKLDNIFLFDFGSLMDALCGWNTRAWITLTNFNASKFLNHLTSEIKIVCTSALLDQSFEKRKQEYIRNLEILSEYGYTNPYIVEAISTSPPTFLDNYSSNIYYPMINDLSLRNKGINEALSLKKAFKFFNFNDNDMIVKITGRYFFTSNEFLKTIENNPTIDAFVKTDQSGQVFTGCYALRYKYFKDMLETIDYIKMEKEFINIEQEVAIYLQKIIFEKNASIAYIDHLFITANIFGDGIKTDLQYW